MTVETFALCLQRIRRHVPTLDAPVSRLKVLHGREPFRIAVGTILSARTRDATLIHVLGELFRVVRTPEDVLALPPRRLQAILRPIGFFRMKARTLRRFARMLVERHGGRVPDTMEELLALPGIGIKVAAIVLVDAFGKRAISVDTHVHRISNRMGLVRTTIPERTSAALHDLLPRRLWRHVNFNLVALGQTICDPLRPRCDACPVDALCPKHGVRRAPTLRAAGVPRTTGAARAPRSARTPRPAAPR
jgi:endonuclease-3